MSQRVDRAERLLNLVFALMSTSHAVPRSVIREQVPGYGEAASDSAFERMFERDKDELRSMGVPIETVSDEFGDVQGYRIIRDVYAMPPMDLTLAERSAITVAAQVWGHAQVAPVAGTAVRKMESMAVEAAEWTPSDLAGDIRLTSSDAALLPLMSAIRAGVVVQFDYRSPTAADASRRTVSPWRLSTREGHWMLNGFDHDRDAVRTFRVSRVTGTVQLTTRTRLSPEPIDDIATEASGGFYRARVEVEPGHGASLRRRAVPAGGGWTQDVFDVEVATLDELVSLICAAGSRARVVGPAEAASAVQQAWLEIASAHGSGAS